jgi:hypothetical protein
MQKWDEESATTRKGHMYPVPLHDDHIADIIVSPEIASICASKIIYDLCISPPIPVDVSPNDIVLHNLPVNNNSPPSNVTDVNEDNSNSQTSLLQPEAICDISFYKTFNRNETLNYATLRYKVQQIPPNKYIIYLEIYLITYLYMLGYCN